MTMASYITTDTKPNRKRQKKPGIPPLENAKSQLHFATLIMLARAATKPLVDVTRIKIKCNQLQGKTREGSMREFLNVSGGAPSDRRGSERCSSRRRHASKEKQQKSGKEDYERIGELRAVVVSKNWVS